MKTPTSIKKLINSKRRTGLKFYAHGIQIIIPNIETGEHTKLTFKGSFDRKKLRRMLRASLVARLTTQQLDWVIDTYGTKLREMTNEEVNAMLIAAATDDEE